MGENEDLKEIIGFEGGKRFAFFPAFEILESSWEVTLEVLYDVVLKVRGVVLGAHAEQSQHDWNGGLFVDPVETVNRGEPMTVMKRCLKESGPPRI